MNRHWEYLQRHLAKGYLHLLRSYSSDLLYRPFLQIWEDFQVRPQVLKWNCWKMTIFYAIQTLIKKICIGYDVSCKCSTNLIDILLSLHQRIHEIMNFVNVDVFINLFQIFICRLNFLINQSITDETVQMERLAIELPWGCYKVFYFPELVCNYLEHLEG